MKNIIFDVDGTLWDTTEVVAQAWNKAITDVGGTSITVSAERLKKEFGKPMDVIANHLFSDASEIQKALLLDKCCEYEQLALEEYNDNLLYPEVLETIKKLSNKYNLYIISNCHSGYIELFIKKNGIESYIKDFECFGNTGKSKGENIQLVLNRNHLKDAIYVGDTQGDYEATVYANVPFVYAKYGFGKPENYTYSINEFKEILKLNY